MFEFTYSKLSSFLSSIRFNKTYSNNEINDIINNLQKIMLESDIPYAYVKAINNKIESKIREIKYKHINKATLIGDLIKINFNNTFKNCNKKLSIIDGSTNVVGIFGTNGVGKTSFAVKLANEIKQKYNKSVLCVSLDNKRPAGEEQLKILCINNDISFFQLAGSDIKDRVGQINKLIKCNIADVILIDSAGVNLLKKDNSECEKELKLITNEIKFNEKIVLLDGTFGQGAVNVIKKFSDLLSPTGFVITKMDTDQKGGVYFAIRMASKQPIYYITTGEKIRDIKQFNKIFIINTFFGNNGIKKIITPLGDKKNKQDYSSTICNLEKNKINYSILLEQLKSLVNKDGITKNILFTKKTFFKLNDRMTTEVYILIKKWIAIIQSMTKYERNFPHCLNMDRMNRISKGSGIGIADIITLKKKIEKLNMQC